jgi:hypothetical protein
MRHGNIRFCSDMKDSRHDDRRNGRDAAQESEEKHRNTTRFELSPEVDHLSFLFIVPAECSASWKAVLRREL